MFQSKCELIVLPHAPNFPHKTSSYCTNLFLILSRRSKFNYEVLFQPTQLHTTVNVTCIPGHHHYWVYFVSSLPSLFPQDLPLKLLIWIKLCNKIKFKRIQREEINKKVCGRYANRLPVHPNIMAIELLNKYLTKGWKGRTRWIKFNEDYIYCVYYKL